MNKALAYRVRSFPRQLTKGLYCSPLFDMFIQFSTNTNENYTKESGRATIEARSSLYSSRVVGLTKASRHNQKATLLNLNLSRGLCPPAYQSKRRRVSLSSPGNSKSFLSQREWRRGEATRRRSFASGTKPSLKDRLGAGGQAFWAGKRLQEFWEARPTTRLRLQEAKLRRLDK